MSDHPLASTSFSQKPAGEYVIKNTKTRPTLEQAWSKDGEQTPARQPYYIFLGGNEGWSSEFFPLFAPSGDFLPKVQKAKELPIVDCKNEEIRGAILLTIGDFLLKTKMPKTIAVSKGGQMVLRG